ncbi:MAG: CaiB/BaiF CoA transferase family protein [Gammaproteobacteria bacterium]
MEPLQGIRIIDVTTNASGPMAAGMLADQGADVIRFETVGSGDPSRHVGGTRGGVSAYNAYMNRNKRSMAVDLKNGALRPWLYKLVETADVFIQNSRPGALDRCGFGFGDLHRINPNLVYVSISGFGQTGPGAKQRVYDPVIQCVSGFAAAQGTGGEPTLMKTIASDKVAAVTAAQAISSALFARQRGLVQGHHVEISMLDASLAFLWPEVFWNHGFVGADGVTPKAPIAEFYKLLRTADGAITMIIVGDGEFAGACRALGTEAMLDNPHFRTLSDRFAHYGEMHAAFEAASMSRHSDELIARLLAEDVPCAKVNTLDEVCEDPRVTHRQSVIEYDHPRGGRLRQARAPAIFAGEPCTVRRPAPALGEHTMELLKSVGATAGDLDLLLKAGAIG